MPAIAFARGEILMRANLSVALILAACVTTELAAASPCTLALNSVVPIRQDGTIDVKIDGGPARLRLDTGASTTIISSDAAKRLHLHADPDTAMTIRGLQDPLVFSGIGGSDLTTEVMAKRFEVGAITGRKFHLMAGGTNDRTTDGLLSTDFLQDYDIDLNFPAQEIRLFRQFGSCDRPKILLHGNLYTIPLLQSEDDSRPRVEVFIDNRRLVALLDTGAWHSSIYRKTALSLGIRPEDLQRDPALKVNGTVSAVMHIFPALTIGDLTLRNTRMVVLDDHKLDDTDILLGADFQHRLHLWISNSSHLLIMQYPPVPSEPLPKQPW
jgi:clan AA aspartic protease (TIGR02281 family)